MLRSIVMMQKLKTDEIDLEDREQILINGIKYYKNSDYNKAIEEFSTGDRSLPGL